MSKESPFLVKSVRVLRMGNDEYRSLVLRYSFFRFAFGEMIIAVSDRGVCFAGFGNENGDFYGELSRRFPYSVLVEDCFDNPFGVEECVLHLWGTDFQICVWSALLGVGKGKVATYSDIACALRKPKALRAVGTAVGKNPVAVVIPCHRIIRSDGNIGNYHYGANIKRLLLDIESI